MRKPATLARHGNSYQLTIPKKIREYLRWDSGEELMLTISENGKLIVTDLETFLLEDHQRRRAEEHAQLMAAR